MQDWPEWIGRTETRRDRLDEGLAARWLATFDREPAAGQPLPQGIHFCLCTPYAPTADLGEDGHPARSDGPGSFLPPVPLPRRMWASSAMEFLSPIHTGAAITRTSRIASVTPKSGKSGDMVFVDVVHETAADGTPAVTETQTLVYREAAAADAPLSPPPGSGDSFDAGAWDAVRTLTPDARLLFRYSALTFNTHRIHYDAPYARDVERYRGLVVHGPLTASLLLQLAADELGPDALRHFAFRGVSPAIAGEPLHLALRRSASKIELAAFAGDGRQVTKASAGIAG
ncbi:MaoC family dehydratase N-terminal domain-containing protein [Erythrobacteraceae bacterium WH01K]|nr:MaoC family dehydratase N-terminal domain-containing protein [Erythrobacteraceae bacterium WH01K]